MPEHDPLLDPPAWAPTWLPSLRRTASVRALRVAIGIVLAAGVVACFSEGANAPADPTLAPPGDNVDVSDTERASVCETPDAAYPSETESLVAQFGVVSLSIVTDDEAIDLCVLVASDGEQRARGLMTVTGFEGFDGMVFVYDDDSSGAYYMFNTPTALTIYWWDGAGNLVSSAEMEPCLDLPATECPRYPADGAYRYALEVPLGALDGVIADSSVLQLGPAPG